MLSTLSCRVNGQNGITLLGWIYLVNLFWVSHHAYHHFDVEQLMLFPSLSNSYRWNISTETSCQLCQLGACKVALQQWGFTFWHVFVVHVLLSKLQSFLLSCTVSKTNCDTSIKLVKNRSKPQYSTKKKVVLFYFLNVIRYWSLII